MVLIAHLKDENYLGWDRSVRLNIKGIGRQTSRRHLQAGDGDSCEVEGRVPSLLNTCQWATLRNCDFRELRIKDKGCILAKYEV